MVNQNKIKQAVELFLEGIGEDAGREGLNDTPERVARMCTEIFAGIGENASEHLSKTFPIEHNEIVLEKDIDFYSVCEHHLLPFFGKAHIAYIPDGRVVGLSKLARTVEVYAARPQIQEQMTAQIADALMEYLAPQGVMVMLEAGHMCMMMRGVKKTGSKTVTIAKRGCFEENEKLQDDFFKLLNVGKITDDRNEE